MAKSKNHTGHNQVYKNHRNGIKKTRRPKKMSMIGMNCKFVRNQAYAKRGMKCTPEEKDARLAAQKEAQKRMEEKKAIERAQRVKELEAEKEAEKLKAANKQAKKDAAANKSEEQQLDSDNVPGPLKSFFTNHK